MQPRPIMPDERPAPTPVTITIAAMLDGYPITIAFDGSITQIPAAIARLRALGAQPSAPLAAPTAPIAAPDDLPDGWKLCRKHGAPMRPRQKQGDTWHSHNMGTPDRPIWCKGYAGADSPGYEVD